MVSGKSLEKLRNHYKLDNMLSSVYVPKIAVKWDDDSLPSQKKAKSWNCGGRADYYIIFDWLKDPSKAGVKKVLEIVVDDSGTDGKLPHSDEAILHCLQDLGVEVWDWKRLDISSDLIFRIAGDHIRQVQLYCSGLNAVLRGWSAVSGLPRLKNVGQKTFPMLEKHCRVS